MCDVESCPGVPKYGVDGEEIPNRCYAHRKGHKRFGSTKCACGKQAIYGYIYGVTLCCLKCKEPDMTNVNDKRCMHDECSTLPSYNLPGEKIALYCVKHKLLNMVDIKNKTCHHDSCCKQPSYNLPGEKMGLYCAKHKLPNMVDIIHKTCQHDSCCKRPHYNLPGEKMGLYCAKHKLPNMVNIIHKTCQHDSCCKQPSYNLPGEKIGLYCVQHKLLNMVNIISKTCQHDSCCKQPSYNLPGEKIGLYCVQHKLPNMVDIKNKTCHYDSCCKRATFGEIGQQPNSCVKHKTPKMVFRPRQQCVEPKCTEVATHHYNNIRTHCCDHIIPGDVSLLDKCVSCKLEYILHSDRKCFACTGKIHELFRNAKENEIKQLFNRESLEYHSHDKIVDAGECIKYRPDFLFFGNGWAVIVEVDENQHKDRQEQCECIRMVNIHQALAMPVIFIRYNPDRYKGQQISKTPRQEILLDWTKFYMANKPRYELSYVHLFFDGYKKGEVEPTPIAI